MILRMKYLTNEFLLGLFLCVTLLMGTFGMTACTSEQIAKTETIIATDLPIVISDVTSILSLIAALQTTGSDATSDTLTNVIATIKSKAQDVETILAAYKAGTNKWTDVIAAVDALEAAASSTIDLAGIKNADSKAKAQAWLSAIDVAIGVIYTAVLTTQSTSTVKAKISTQKATLKNQSSIWTPVQRQQFVSQLYPLTGFTSFGQYQAIL